MAHLQNSIDLELRLMEKLDCEAVSQLQSTLDYSGWSSKQWSEALEHYPCAWILLANSSDSNEVVGYIIYQTSVSQVELLNLGIKASYQGKGIASELLESSIDLLPSSSESIFLEVRRSNIPAIKLYEKHSFESVGVRRNYYSAAGGIREDALVYRYDFELQT